MRRGASCGPFVITVDRDISGYKRVVLTIRDAIGASVDLEKEALTITADSVRFALTEAQSLALKKGAIYLQLRAKNSSTDALVSNVMLANMDGVLKDGELDVSQSSI